MVRPKNKCIDTLPTEHGTYKHLDAHCTYFSNAKTSPNQSTKMTYHRLK
jgi:hypothetical protein